MKAIVTRPAHQAQMLVQSLESQGFMVELFPTLEIEHLPLSDEQLGFLAMDWDVAVFTSANGVLGLQGRWPTDSKAPCLAIGPGTARAMKHAGIPVTDCPSEAQGHDSEGLLKLTALRQLSGKKILLICGKNPRAFFTEHCRQAGAQVQQLAVYERHCPKVDMKPVMARWQEESQQAPLTFYISSAEGFDNLKTLCQGHLDWLEQQRFHLSNRKLQDCQSWHL